LAWPINGSREAAQDPHGFPWMDMEDFCLSLRCHRQWTLLSAGRWVSRAATNVSEQRLSLIDQLPSTNFIKDLVVERCSVALRRRSGRTAQRLISNEAIPFVVSLVEP